jgi:N-sulfoglucosamine sulfohydrolase
MEKPQRLISRFIMKTLVLLFLLAVALHAAEKPNLVFIIADDCTHSDIACYGGQAHTPNIDQLASEGMRFTRCFQTAPMCSPTRHSIYTGQYPVKTGAYPNHTFVRDDVKSVVQYLKPLGYRVAQSGKTHVSPNSVFAWEKLNQGKNKDPDFKLIDAFLKDCRDQSSPFCLLICSNQPHTPWNKGDASKYPPEKIKIPPIYVDTPETREGMSRYLAEITYYDSEVGQALDLLEENGLTDNTLVIVVSEQGNSLPFAKWTCYDRGLQSAFIARWPGKIEAGSVNPAMIEYVDILPTFIEAAGGTPAPEIDGRSLLPVFAGQQQHKDHVYGLMTTRGINHGSDYFGIRSVRSGQYKLIWNFTPEVEFKNACTSSKEFESWEAKGAKGDKKAQGLVKRYKFRPEIELYDITKDPEELSNLANDPEYAEVRRELRAKLEKWMNHCGDKGQATELKAKEHQGRGAAKKSD